MKIFDQKLTIPQRAEPDIESIAADRSPVDGKIQFHKLTPEELELIVAIGVRAGAAIRDLMKARKGVDIEPDPQLIAMDVAVVHLSRPLQLMTFLRANDLDFISEIVTIQTNIQRGCGSLPVFVPLRYAAPMH